MKKIIIFSLCVVLFNSINAQTVKNLDYYNKQIEMLIEDCSAGELKKDYYIIIDFADAILSLSEKEEVIKKIESLYKQEDCIWLYESISYSINNFFFHARKDSTPVIRQKLVELYLKYYFYPYLRSSYIPYASKEDFNPNAQKRLIEILEGKKTKEEYELYVKKWRELEQKSEFGWSEATRIMKESNREGDDVLKQIRDSIIETREIPMMAHREFDRQQISEWLVFVMGDLELKNSIPALQKALMACEENNCQPALENSYRITLARLGDKEQYNYMVNNMLDIDIFNVWHFIYFRDDELIWKYLELNYDPKRKVPSGLSGVSLPADFMTVQNIAPYIKNLPEDLQFPTKARYVSEQEAWGKEVYKWLIENKERVEFDYDGEKNWFW